jgi:hypothetical protein
MDGRRACVTASEDLFNKVTGMLGLAMILAPGTLKRALKAAGADWETAQRDDYLRMLANLEARLQSYMDPAEAKRRVEAIGKLLEDSSG